MKILLVGNELRKDDGIALRLKIPGAIKAGLAPENFIREGDEIVLIDAVDFKARPGEVRILNPEEIQSISFGTHKPSIKILQTLCKKLVIIGIQPADTGWGEELSPELAKGLREIELDVTKLLRISQS